MYKAGLFSLALAAGSLAQDACNGFTELCDRRYSDITFAAAHNAAFVGRGPSHNQFEYPEQGMDMGIRYFTTQVHIEDGEIRQCHSDCFLLDVGPFSEIVASIKNWLDAHPREVVTLLIGNGDDDILIEEFQPAFDGAGARDMLFEPGGNLGLDDWPTLGELIDTGKRFIVFMGTYLSSDPFGGSPWLTASRLQRRPGQGPVHHPAVRPLRRNALQPYGGQLLQLRR